MSLGCLGGNLGDLKKDSNYLYIAKGGTIALGAGNVSVSDITSKDLKKISRVVQGILSKNDLDNPNVRENVAKINAKIQSHNNKNSEGCLGAIRNFFGIGVIKEINLFLVENGYLEKDLNEALSEIAFWESQKPDETSTLMIVGQSSFRVPSVERVYSGIMNKTPAERTDDERKIVDFRDNFRQRVANSL